MEAQHHAIKTSERDSHTKESARLAALKELDILDSPKDQAIDRITRVIRNVFAVDIGLVSMIDAHRQWYKSCEGLSASEIARRATFCQFTLDSGTLMVVPDTQRDNRFCNHPNVVGEPGIRFYAGAPLRTRDGHIIGTVCAIDTKPREFSATEASILTDLADVVMDRLELLRLASADGLTGALTRRAFKEESSQAISLALRHAYDVSCLVFDLDHFKLINDNYGHPAGDDVLMAVAAVVRENLRDSDLLGRLGGEEFAVLLPYVDADGAMLVAERLREAIAAVEHSLGRSKLKATASFGVATLGGAINTIDGILACADAALYTAKNEGRNRCVQWDKGFDGSSFARHPVLKAGSIILNGERSVVDCTVKSLGEMGAGLVVSDASTLPGDFTLVIRSEGLEVSCRVLSQNNKNVEVEFF